MKAGFLIVNVFMHAVIAKTGVLGLCVYRESVYSKACCQRARALRKHPNHCFVNYLLPGLMQVFHVNLQSALKVPGVGDSLLVKVQKRYTVLPFDSSYFPVFPD